jgi:hypothetical protein
VLVLAVHPFTVVLVGGVLLFIHLQLYSFVLVSIALSWLGDGVLPRRYYSSIVWLASMLPLLTQQVVISFIVG